MKVFRRASVQVKRERINQLGLGALLVALFGGGALALRILLGAWPSIRQLRLLELVGLVLMLIVFWLLRAKPRKQEVVADERVIQVGEDVYPLFALRALRLKKDKDGARVRIVKTWWSRDIDVMLSEEDATELMEITGSDVGHKVAALEVSSPLRPYAILFRIWPIAAILALFSLQKQFFTHYHAYWPLGLLVLVLPVIVGLQPAKLHVGADGVLRRWIGTRRFVKLADIRSVIEEDRAVALQLVDGTTWRIPAIESGTVAATIRQAMETHGTSRAGTEIAALERGTRTIAEWIGRLKQLGEGANASLRTAPLAPDRLWAIVEDPQAEANVRVAATIALHSAGEIDKTRIVRVARAVAAPKLRVALETCASAEDDEAYARALAELE